MAEKDTVKKPRPSPKGKDAKPDLRKAGEDAARQISEAKERLQAGELDAQALTSLLKEGGANAEALKAQLEKSLSPEALQNIAKGQPGGDVLNTLTNAASGEGAELKQVADVAVQIGQQAGLSEKQLEMFKGFGNITGEIDRNAVGKIPGLMVNKDTGKISVLGLFDMDANDPMARVIANGLSFAFGAVMLPVNKVIYEQTYRAGSWSANQFNLTKASNHRIGMAAAVAATAGASFWPAINNYIRVEAEYRNGAMDLANKFAPFINDYMPGSGSRIAKFYQISPDQNEIIVNERRRHHQQHDAERWRVAVSAMGQVPLFAFSVIDGQQKLGVLRKQAEAQAQLDTQAAVGEEAQAAFLHKLSEKAKFIEQHSQGMIKGEQAIEMARTQLDPHVQLANGEVEAAAGSMGLGSELVAKIKDAGTSAAGPLMDWVSNKTFRKKLDDRGVQPVSASMMIFHLRKQLERDPEAEKYSLPKDMAVVGDESGGKQIRLEEYIEQIFRQHERDCVGADGLIPARYDKRLDEACEMMAKALRQGRLDGLALIKLVGERKIVRPNGKSVAENDIISQEIERLEHEMRHVEYVDRDRYFAESSFTPEELKKSWDGMDSQEREVFSLLVPMQVLESVGVSPAELHDMRSRRQARFYEDMATISRSLSEMGTKTLEEMGVTQEEAALFKRMSDSDASKDSGDIASRMGRDSLAKATHAVVNLVVSSKHQGRVIPEAQRQPQA